LKLILTTIHYLLIVRLLINMSSKIVIDDFTCVLAVFDDWINSINFKDYNIQELYFCNFYYDEDLLDEDEHILQNALFQKFAELYYNRFKLPIVMVVTGVLYMRDYQEEEMCMNHEKNAILSVQGILYEMYEGSIFNDDMDILIEYFRRNLAQRYSESNDRHKKYMQSDQRKKDVEYMINSKNQTMQENEADYKNWLNTGKIPTYNENKEKNI
jgi:hypothetical protein